MAVTVVATNGANTNTTSTAARSITLPSSGINDGDYLVLLVSKTGSQSGTFSGSLAGYDTIDSGGVSGNRSFVLTKILATSDVNTTLTFTPTATSGVDLTYTIFRGLRSTASPVVGTPGLVTNTTSSPTKVSPTTVTDEVDCMFLMVASLSNTDGPSGPVSSLSVSGLTTAVTHFDSRENGGCANGGMFYNLGPYASGVTLGGQTVTSNTDSGSGIWSIHSIALKIDTPPAAADNARPASIVSNPDAWSNVGGAASIVAALADESDTTAAESPAITAGPYRLTLAYDALSSGLVTVATRVKLTTSGSQTLVTTLLQGSTTIASWSDTVDATTAVDLSHTTTSLQASAISDYSALRVEYAAS